ncbi:Tyrosine recombinase XerD [Nocardioides dokdonensis FR1436]|uniref:Tyrosine recombinase XerD n=1 Tax=Nocardioides dokdonensis FR1436 TaxID=1300347 RepID=A0A1A9GIU4_9ACTN|nr:tyrosine-type recombinase/integrase [Nocardioides dokdonensis]ANH37543.1 Tyrosine recombinase XerD [Nocardioides dokdonensis FR1436]ANH38914.1 Tyrosine recombinase XerD [Nocardioides dokdonensis FR1436]
MSGPLLLPTWEELGVRPQVVATMRRYLEQLGCVLRPGSVAGADLALRSFAAYLVEAAPEVTSIAQVTRRHVEDYKPWLAARPGQNKDRVTIATLAHRLGTLRMFFVRIDEWGWDQAPPRVPMFPGDLPRQDHPLPKALDDAAAAKLLRAAQAEPRLLVRVTIEVLLRTGLRVSEFTALSADAVVQIGAAPWLHVPVGKLREDRYLPLHPHLVVLIEQYRTAHVPAEHPLLLPRENGRALDRHTVTRFINKAGTAAGLAHIHPHQLRHTLATQAINRGMSLEAIAAMLGHRSMDMTLRYAKIANRTVADEYFAVTDQVDALYAKTEPLPADAIGPKMARLRREHHRLLGNGHCTRPAELDCAFESICENCSFFQTSIEFRPTLQAQHDDAEKKGQHHRADLFGQLLTGLTEGEAS